MRIITGICYCFLPVLFIFGCTTSDQENAHLDSLTLVHSDYDYIKAIPGENDTIPTPIIQRGEVLIAYSDCYTCHTESKRFKGPAFKDIAKRYPVKRVYIDMLAQKVISGGSGAWGNPVMSAHPEVSFENARTMVSYILSLKEL